MDEIQELAAIKAEADTLRIVSIDIDQALIVFEESVLSSFKVISNLVSENTERMNNLYKRIDKLSEKYKEKAESSGSKKPEVPEKINEEKKKKEIKVEETKKTSSTRTIKIESLQKSGSFKTVQIKGEYIPKHSYDIEYKRMFDLVYNYPEYEEIFYSSGNTIYPRVTAINGADPNQVLKLAEFGFLDLIYLSKEQKEISGFEDTFKSKVSQFAKGRQCVLKFYTISPELDGNRWYEALHIVSINPLYSNISLEVGRKSFKAAVYSPEWVITRRALGIKAIQSISENLLNKGFQTICAAGNWILVTKGSINDPKSGLLQEFHNTLTTHRVICSSATRQEACKLIGCHTEFRM